MFGQKFLFILFLFVFFVFPNFAQNCQPPVITANSNANNLFSSDQEMVLGEMTFQQISREIRLIRDEKLLEKVNEIGGKIIRHLPSSGLKFQFYIIDIPEVNAFNIPGGHVFISRKLISFTGSEDELAGVIAHELGHATVRHGALDMSEYFRKILRVNSLGDRKDVEEKYNLLIENARTRSISQKSSHEDVQQIEADKIGLFGMVAAGYDPNAFITFFDRLAETEGKTGEWWSDIFGKARPSQKRLREMIQLTQQLPAACRERVPAESEEFQKWQAEVVSFRESNRKEVLPALIWKKELGSKLRSDINNILFSADGKYLLAQDDFNITVMSREPFETLFQIPAAEAQEAFFTPDNKQIVFVTRNLRFERWDLEQRKPVEIKELFLRSECWESQLSPNGAFLACIDVGTKINIFDTNTGKKVFEKKDFYQLDYLEYIAWLEKVSDPNYKGGVSFFRLAFTPDSKFVVCSRSNKFRFRFRVNGTTLFLSENTAVAINLTEFKVEELSKDLKKLTSRAYVFLDSERIVGLAENKVEDAGIFSFPGGKRLAKFDLYSEEMKNTQNQSYVVVKPLVKSKIGIFDVSKGILMGGMNKEAASVWNNILAFESGSGKILLQQFIYDESQKKYDAQDLATLEIPIGKIGNLNIASVSDNFNHLILSSKSRGGMWNLETGERKIFVRGFSSGIASDDGLSVVEFSKNDDAPHSLVLMNPKDNTTTSIVELPEKGARQYGRFILLRKSLSETTNKDQKNSKESGQASDDSTLHEKVKFELLDIVLNKTIWTRDFPRQVPRFSFDSFSGRLIFYWDLGSEVGKEKLKNTPELQGQAKSLGDKNDDFLVEVVDAFAQKTIGSFLLETGKGSFSVFSGVSERDWLMLYDSEDRVLLYSIKTGELIHRFFGKFAVLNPTKNQIVIENFSGEVTLFNLDTGLRENSFVIDGNVALLQYNLSGNKLFVLSDNQNAYTFDLNKLSAQKE